MNKRKQYQFLYIVFILLFLTGCKSGETDEVKQIKDIIYDNFYESHILNSEEAREAIIADGIEKRTAYTNKKINKIEKRLEKKYKLLAVNLGIMDKQTALLIEDSCEYMFETYPILKGHITNIIVSNLEDGIIAKFDDHMFIHNDSDSLYPFVMKTQIILNAEEFLNPIRLNNMIKSAVLDGYWMKDMNINALLVHEMSHALTHAIRCQKNGLKESIYINEENSEAFSKCMTESLAVNQNTEKEICNTAYEKYKQDNKLEISYEEFCGQISGYAIGLQEDGGYSYSETCAEACVDVYLHGEDCSEASRLIVEIIQQLSTIEKQ